MESLSCCLAFRRRPASRGRVACSADGIGSATRLPYLPAPATFEASWAVSWESGAHVMPAGHNGAPVAHHTCEALFGLLRPSAQPGLATTPTLSTEGIGMGGRAGSDCERGVLL